MKTGNHTFKADPNTQSQYIAGSNRLTLERNRAYLLIILLLMCITALSIAVAYLAKIHTVVPVIAVIDAKGHVIKQQIVDTQTIKGQDSFIQSQIYDFITYCNTFDPPWRQRYADLCRLHSDQTIANQYDRETAAENPNNPYYQIGKDGRRYPKITGITSIGENAYQVAFQLITEKPNLEPQTEYFTALVQYSFTYKPLAIGDRWENPMGFLATAYRKDQELSRK